MGNLSKNFSDYEFTDSDKATELQINNLITNGAIGDNLRYLVETLLQPLRDEIGWIKINSGYRCNILNRAVGGVYNSDHLLGIAADIVPKSCSIPKVVAIILEKFEFNQLIPYIQDGFIHVSLLKSNKKEIFYK